MHTIIACRADLRAPSFQRIDALWISVGTKVFAQYFLVLNRIGFVFAVDIARFDSVNTNFLPWRMLAYRTAKCNALCPEAMRYKLGKFKNVDECAKKCQKTAGRYRWQLSLLHSECMVDDLTLNLSHWHRMQIFWIWFRRERRGMLRELRWSKSDEFPCVLAVVEV